MKKQMCLLLILTLTLGGLTASYAEDKPADTLKAADVNADGIINILDLTLVASHFGKAIDAEQIPNPDVNADGIVSILDLVIVAEHTGKTVRMPATFVSAVPAAESQLEVNDTLTLTFDNTPEAVTVSAGNATITDNTVTITGPFDTGNLTLTITWTDGTQTLDYNVRAPATFIKADPISGATVEVNDTLTFTFDNTPEAVTVNVGTATITDNTVTITGPFDTGNLNLTVNWSDGSQTLTYLIRTPDTEAPTITVGTVTDGDQDVDPKTINGTGQIEVIFSEAVTGNITLQTAAGNDVGWTGTVQDKKGTLERAKGEALDNETTYVITGTISDAAGNKTDFNITFETASKTSGIPFDVNDVNFDTLVLGSDIPTVVEFYTDW